MIDMTADMRNNTATRVRIIDSADGKEHVVLIPHHSQDKYLAVGYKTPYPGDSLAFRYLGFTHRDTVDVLSMTQVKRRGGGNVPLVRYHDVMDVPELWEYIDNPSKKTTGKKLALTYFICCDVLENSTKETPKTSGLKKKLQKVI